MAALSHHNGSKTSSFLPPPLSPRTHNAARTSYSPECVEGRFCELRPNGVLGSSHSAARVGHLALGHLFVQLRSHHHAFLLVGVGPRPYEDSWPLAAIDRHMGHSRRKVEVVAGMGDVPMLYLLARVHFHLFAADHAERGLVLLVDMGLGTPASWRERHRAEPERLGADSLRAYPRDVVWSLLTLVALPRVHHSPKILEPCRFSHSHSSNDRPSVPSLVT